MTTPINPQFLAHWREAMGGISQEEAAEKIGRSRRQWLRWESGEAPTPFWLPLVLTAVFHRLAPWGCNSKTLSHGDPNAAYSEIVQSTLNAYR